MVSGHRPSLWARTCLCGCETGCEMVMRNCRVSQTSCPYASGFGVLALISRYTNFATLSDSAPLSSSMYFAAASVTALVLAYTMTWLRPGIKLSGKHVIITGGSEGLGYCLARELCLKGCRITILARTQSKLDQALVQLRELEVAADVQALPADVTKFEQVIRLPYVSENRRHNVADSS